MYLPKKLDKACSGHDMSYGDFKDFHRKFKDYLRKHLILIKIWNMMGIKEVLFEWLNKLLIKSILFF